MKILKTAEFAAWLDGLDPVSRRQVEDRFDRIQQHRHFGDQKALGGSLHELRWRNGRRIYFVTDGGGEGRRFIALYGGTKHGQSRDIAKARGILLRVAAEDSP